MPRKLDLSKTQFLVDPSGKIRMFRRKSATMLFHNGQPERVVTWEEWLELKGKAEGLTLRNIWTLVEVFLDAEA